MSINVRFISYILILQRINLQMSNYFMTKMVYNNIYYIIFNNYILNNIT
jgi:hypothetical protein